MRRACFTICSNNYLPFARVFARSFKKHHPEIDLFLGLADTFVPGLPYPDDCQVLAADELEIPDFPAFAFRYDIMEFNTAIKPFVILALLKKGYEDVIYFDPDIELHLPLGSVLAALSSGASFVFTPHLCSPAEDGAPRTDIDIMRTGVFNLGFLAVSRQEETERILRWWARRLRYQCVNNQTGGLFVDQKFMDLVPAFADRVAILRDTSLNVAYWNLAQRRLERTEGGWTVDGRPLTFFHYSGFDPFNIDRVTKHTSGFGNGIPDPVSGLLERYAESLLAEGYDRAVSAAYGYGAFASGTPIPDLVRRMFRERHLDWAGSPFENYEAYLHLPNAEVAFGSPRIVTNLMKYIHDTRPDLRSRFNLGRPADAESFVEWYLDHGPGLGLPRDLIETASAHSASRS